MFVGWRQTIHDDERETTNDDDSGSSSSSANNHRQEGRGNKNVASAKPQDSSSSEEQSSSSSSESDDKKKKPCHESVEDNDAENGNRTPRTRTRLVARRLALRQETVESLRGHPIQQIRFQGGPLDDGGEDEASKDDDDDARLRGKEQAHDHRSAGALSSLGVDGATRRRFDSTDTYDAKGLGRLEVFSILLFVGSITLLCCWMLGYIPADSSTSIQLMKISGWLVLIFLALFPTSAKEGDEDQQAARQTSIFDWLIPSRKIQMLIVYIVSWDLFVANIQQGDYFQLSSHG